MATEVVVILSAGPIPESLTGDLGKVRNSMIPFDGKPLFLSIMKEFEESSEIYIALDVNDLAGIEYAKTLKCKFLLINGDNSLALGLKEALTQIMETRQNDFSFQLIFGDTLVTPIDAKDFVGVVGSRIDYQDWTTVIMEEGLPRFSNPGKPDEKTVAGYFGFSSAFDLIDSLESLSFYDALKIYASRNENRKLLMEELSEWLDFGRLDTFYESKSSKLASRSFNTATFQKRTLSVEKSSSNIEKISEEISWFEDLKRNEIDYLAPRLVNADRTSGKYEIEYVADLTVAETFLYAKKSIGYWSRFYESLGNYLADLYRPAGGDGFPDSDVINLSYQSRLEKRFQEIIKKSPDFLRLRFATSNGWTTLETIVSYLQSWLSTHKPVHSLTTHGDLFFGNLFFRERFGQVVGIDPRGISEGKRHFDFEYDFAKLGHSINSGYDFLAADLFDLTEMGDVIHLELPWNDNSRKIQGLGKSWISQTRTRLGISQEYPYPLEAFLFTSMVPLHFESPRRQIASICAAAQLLESEIT